MPLSDDTSNQPLRNIDQNSSIVYKSMCMHNMHDGLIIIYCWLLRVRIRFRKRGG